MAGVLRKLVTQLVLDGFRKASGELKKYDALWKTTAKSVEASADLIERASSRAMSVLSNVGAVAAGVRASAGAARGGGGGGRRSGGDPIDAAMRQAKADARAQQQAERAAEAQRRSIERTENRKTQVSARRAGLDAGAVRVDDATKALGVFATASDRAKAKVADLSAQVERNRRDMANLREQALRTGDADGALAGKMQGLAVATNKVQGELREARSELRKVDGGLIDAIKSAAGLAGKFDVLKIAAGNLLSAGISRGLGLVRDGLVGSAKSAIDFESAMADVRKVLSAPDLKNFDALSDGVKRVSREIGVMPNDVAKLTASLAQSGIAGDELLTTAEDASKLAVAFGVSGEEAGQALAKLRTGLGLSRDEVNSLTGTINVLSNNLAATAPEITDAVQRVGSVGKAANLSGQTVAALATSMIASGANAEVAATGTKNFIRALGAGAAATKRQREAFSALGLSAEETAGYLVKGGKEAEAAISDVVSRIGKLRAEDRLPVLIELFGSESIGAIGPLATNIDLLTRSFNLAGDAAEAADSVEKEFAARSSTTDQAIKKLKASVSVLAIEFGDALLPYINDVVKFLTSPEGQEWGRDAVAKATEAVAGFAEIVGVVANGLGLLIENLGGTGTAAVALGVLVAAMAGPWGIAGAAAAVALAGMVTGIAKVASMIPALNDAVMGIGSSEAVTQKNLDNLRKTMAEDDQRSLGEVTDLDRARRVLGQDVDSPIDSRSGPMFGYGPAPVAGASAAMAASRQGGVVGLAEARAEAKARKEAARRGRGHKATKMDRQLAALDPALAGVLTRGGDTDEGGDLKVHDDALSRGAFNAAASKHGLGGIDRGSGGVGPGPNISNTYNNVTVTVQQAIDARSTAAVPENIRSAARDSGNMAGGVVITGIQRALGMKTGGARMVPG